MTSENTAPPVQVALARAMAEVKGVGKGERNSYHGFNFRGIDSVLNAVGPALRAHQVIPVPKVLEQHSEWVKTTKNKDERLVNLTVQYTFIGPDGGRIETIVVGEASDQGDKAISKAMSVALRTALIQTLALPTDEEDPDAHSPEFSSAPASRQEGQEGSAHQDESEFPDEVNELAQKVRRGLADGPTHKLPTARAWAVEKCGEHHPVVAEVDAEIKRREQAQGQQSGGESFDWEGAIDDAQNEGNAADLEALIEGAPDERTAGIARAALKKVREEQAHEAAEVLSAA